MVGILLVTHGSLGESLIECAMHVFSGKPPQLECIRMEAQDDPTDLLERANALVAALDSGQGVLVMSDLFGATPCNVACRVVRPGRVEGISGLNLSMLIRAITYRNEALPTLVQKALAGGTEGVQPLPAIPNQNAAT
jgi:mannose PTS system EIIA component